MVFLPIFSHHSSNIPTKCTKCYVFPTFNTKFTPEQLHFSLPFTTFLFMYSIKKLIKEFCLYHVRNVFIFYFYLKKGSYIKVCFCCFKQKGLEEFKYKLRRSIEWCLLCCGCRKFIIQLNITSILIRVRLFKTIHIPCQCSNPYKAWWLSCNIYFGFDSLK
jgi:hypothetical protein